MTKASTVNVSAKTYVCIRLTCRARSVQARDVNIKGVREYILQRRDSVVGRQERATRCLYNILHRDVSAHGSSWCLNAPTWIIRSSK